MQAHSDNKTETLRRKAGIQCKLLCLLSVGTVSQSNQVGNNGMLLKSKHPDASQGLTLQARLSKDSSLGPALATIFCTQAKQEINFYLCYKLW